jgi:hypothetical protein
MKYTYVKFKNITDRDFINKFDQEDYLIRANQEEYFPPFLAKHAAKRLADREMILQHGTPMYNTPERNAFVLKCLDLDDETTLDKLQKMSLKEEIDKQREELIENGRITKELTTEEMKREILGDDFEEKTEEKPKNKGGRPKKNKEVEEVEFEGKASAAVSKMNLPPVIE